MKLLATTSHLILVAAVWLGTAGFAAAQHTQNIPPAPGASQNAVERAAEPPVHRWAQKHIVNEMPIPTTPFLDDLTPGYVIIEGDIQVRLEEYLARVLGLDATFGGTGVVFWPGGIVPYDFVTTGNGAVNATNRQRAIDAMDAIASFAGVTFRPASGIENRIRFQNSNFNNSPVGMQGGTQIINIVSWNNQIIIMHEIFHSLGFFHEQSRADRDIYITINHANICGSHSSTACTPGTGTGQCCFCGTITGDCGDCAHNFEIRSSALYWGPYNFDSMMHYGPFHMSCNGQPTITVKPPHTGENMGQRQYASTLDRAGARAMYPFAGDRWTDRTAPLPGSGTFFFPYSDFIQAVGNTPTGGTVFFKTTGNYSGAVGIWSKPMTFRSPAGITTLGN